MSKLKSIALAIDVAAQRRDEASRALVELQRALGFSNNQMEQLASYARDSSNRWMASAQVSALPEMLLHHYQFMDRLEHAIKMQQGVIAEQEQRIELARQVVLKAEFRLAGLKRVMHSRRLEMNARAARQEQRDMDDLAALMHRARQTSIHLGDQV